MRELGFFLGAGAEADLGVPVGTNFLSDIFLTLPSNFLDDCSDDFEYNSEGLKALSRDSYRRYDKKFISRWINNYFASTTSIYYHIKNSKFEELVEELYKVYSRDVNNIFCNNPRMNKLLYLPYFIVAQYYSIEMKKDISIFFDEFKAIPPYVKVNAIKDEENNFIINELEFNKPIFVNLLKNKTFRKNLFKNEFKNDKEKHFIESIKNYFIKTSKFNEFLSLLYIENAEMKYSRNLPLIGNVIEKKFHDDIQTDNTGFRNSVYHYISLLRGCDWTLVTTNYTSYLSVVTKPQPEDIVALHGDFNYLYNRDTMSFEKLNSVNDHYSDIVFPFLILQSKAKILDEIFFMRKFIYFYDRFKETKYIIILGYSFSQDDNHINKIFKTLCKSSKIKAIYYLNFEGDSNIPSYLKSENKFHDIYYEKELLKRNNGFIGLLKQYGFNPAF